MRELRIETADLRDETGGQHTYDYYIVVDEMDVGRFSCESYGVKVRDNARNEEAVVPNVTISAQRIEELSRLLVRNTVTPTSLRDVIDDWL